MTFTAIVKAALELGVVPTIALLLVFAMYRQNKLLAAERREMETRLVGIIGQVLADYQKLLGKQYPPRRGDG